MEGALKWFSNSFTNEFYRTTKDRLDRPPFWDTFDNLNVTRTCMFLRSHSKDKERTDFAKKCLPKLTQLPKQLPVIDLHPEKQFPIVRSASASKSSSKKRAKPNPSEFGRSYFSR